MVQQLQRRFDLPHLLEQPFQSFRKPDHVVLVILANSSKDKAHLEVYMLFLIVLTACLGIAIALVLTLHGQHLLILLIIKIRNILQQFHEAHLREESLLLHRQMRLQGLQLKKLLVNILIPVYKLDDLFQNTSHYSLSSGCARVLKLLLKAAEDLVHEETAFEVSWG